MRDSCTKRVRSIRSFSSDAETVNSADLCQEFCLLLYCKAFNRA